MSVVITRTGSRAILNTIFGAATKPTSFSLNLITAPATAGVDGNKILTYADLTFPTGGGYTAKILTLATASITTSGTNHVVTWPRQTFTFTGPTTPAGILGYAVLDNSNILIFLEFITAYTTLAGYNLCVDVAFRLGNMTAGASISGWGPVEGG